LNSISATVTGRMPPRPVLAAERRQHVDQPSNPYRHVQIRQVSGIVAADRHRKYVHHRPQRAPLTRARGLAASRFVRGQLR
jgi:hypothetical protein